MGSTIFKSKITIISYIAYKCSNCKKYNYFKFLIDETGSESKSGAIHFKSTIDAAYEKATERAKSGLSGKIIKIYLEASNKKYTTLNCKSKCAYCKHKEPWQKLPNIDVDDFFIWMSLVPAMFGIVSLFMREWISFLVCALISLVISFPYFFITNLIRKKREREILELNEESLPKIFLYEKDLNEFIETHDDKTHKLVTAKREREELQREKEDNCDLCPTCGAMLDPDKHICRVCGYEY